MMIVYYLQREEGKLVETKKMVLYSLYFSVYRT